MDGFIAMDALSLGSSSLPILVDVSAVTMEACAIDTI